MTAGLDVHRLLQFAVVGVFGAVQARKHRIDLSCDTFEPIISSVTLCTRHQVRVLQAGASASKGE